MVNLCYGYCWLIDVLGKLVLTGEVNTCNAGTHVTTHTCSEHEEISLYVLFDWKGGIGGGDFLCCS